MLYFPRDFSDDSWYVIELCLLDDERRLLVRPDDAGDSQWCVEKTVPIAGKELAAWSQAPHESEYHPNLLESGRGFYVVGDEWMLEDEWNQMTRERV